MIEALLHAERLLVVGMLDQAEQIYAQAAEQDPQNAIAVVGLARVCVERGDEEAAYGHARRALEIDPQNVAAQRLEARLSEILATRHAPPTPEPPAPGPPAPEAGTYEPLPSEQPVFTRNPSMADHRRVEEQRGSVPRTPPTDDRQPSPQRPGFLRRLLGDQDRGQ